MNTTPVNWNIAKAKLQQKFSTLTAQGLRYLAAERDEFFGRKAGPALGQFEQYLKTENERLRSGTSQDRAELETDPLGLEAGANAHLGKISNAIL